MAKIANELKRVQDENIELKKMIGFILNTLQQKEFIVFNTENRQYEVKK